VLSKIQPLIRATIRVQVEANNSSLFVEIITPRSSIYERRAGPRLDKRHIAATAAIYNVTFVLGRGRHKLILNNKMQIERFIHEMASLQPKLHAIDLAATYAVSSQTFRPDFLSRSVFSSFFINQCSSDREADLQVPFLLFNMNLVSRLLLADKFVGDDV